MVAHALPMAPPSRPWTRLMALVLAGLAQAGALAADPAAGGGPAPAQGAMACAAIGDASARLACFDAWAAQQAWRAPAASARTLPEQAVATGTAAEAPVDAATPLEGCRDPRYSDLSRFWELEEGSSCGTLLFRGYRPISISLIGSDSVNRQPQSGAAGHSALSATAFRQTETRLQLSVRTKLAQGLLTEGSQGGKDSLWFGYTQQSYWQLFSGGISRPFRTTDHEPELVYVYPTDSPLPGGWRLRYSGLGLVHQSNGESLPLSRSWNRVYLMAGAELGDRWQVQGRLWRRLSEGSVNDDNPGISSLIGRAEIRLQWNLNDVHALAVTQRHSLGSRANGSTRLEWLRTLGSGVGGAKSNLRLHTQLFSGYGDSLIDFNRRRTVLSVGLSLLDF